MKEERRGYSRAPTDKKCPTCNGPLVPLYFMGDKNFLDLLVCQKCEMGYDPETLKPLAHVIS